LQQNKVCPLCVQDVEVLMCAQAKRQLDSKHSSYHQKLISSVIAYGSSLKLWRGPQNMF
jgi:predicted amidophosphoribosyltransferase